MDRFVSFQIIWIGVRVIYSVGISEEVKKKKIMGCHEAQVFGENSKTIFFSKTITYALLYRCGVYIRGQLSGNNFTCNSFQDQYHNLNNLLKVQTRWNHFLHVGGLPISMLPFFFFLKTEIEILYLSYQMQLKSKYLHLFTGSEVEHQL